MMEKINEQWSKEGFEAWGKPKEPGRLELFLKRAWAEINSSQFWCFLAGVVMGMAAGALFLCVFKSMCSLGLPIWWK